jgi:hypothetical protein
MMSKVVMAVAVAGMLCGFSVSGMAFLALPNAAVHGLSDLHKVTFGGWPFPYGYAWSRVRACTRYVPVETPRGATLLQRVWVCDNPAHYYDF